MPRTLVTVTGSFANSDGSPASGTLCAIPQVKSSFGTTTYSTEPICGIIDDTGTLLSQASQPFTLLASADAGQTPDVLYRFELRLNGELVSVFKALVGDTTPIAFTALEAAQI